MARMDSRRYSQSRFLHPNSKPYLHLRPDHQAKGGHGVGSIKQPVWFWPENTLRLSRSSCDFNTPWSRLSTYVRTHAGEPMTSLSTVLLVLLASCHDDVRCLCRATHVVMLLPSMHGRASNGRGKSSPGETTGHEAISP